jgi:hypothetical protein
MLLRNQACLTLLVSWTLSNEEATQYLSEIDVAVDDILNLSLADIKVTATPTLLLVDSSGKVKEVWVGKLNPAREKEVIDRLFELR